MNPNHYLAVAIRYLYGGARPGWPASAAIGKTLVSSSMIDRVAARPRPRAARGAGRVQVVRARAARRLGRVRRRGVRRGVVPAARRLGVDHRQGRHHPGAARLGDPGGDRVVARASTTPTWSAQHGDPAYARVDAPASREQKAKLAALSPDDVTATSLAGEPITAKLTDGARQRREDRRAQGDHRERLVRRAAVGHRGRLQDLRRVVPGARPPRAGAGGGAARWSARARLSRLRRPPGCSRPHAVGTSRDDPFGLLPQEVPAGDSWARTTRPAGRSSSDECGGHRVWRSEQQAAERT